MSAHGRNRVDRHRAASLLAAVALPLAALLAGCEGPKKDGTECAHCENDEDCQDGLTCQLFGNQSMVFLLCARSTTKTCDP